jgi:hypothetical protein
MSRTHNQTIGAFASEHATEFTPVVLCFFVFLYLCLVEIFDLAVVDALGKLFRKLKW